MGAVLEAERGGRTASQPGDALLSSVRLLLASTVPLAIAAHTDGHRRHRRIQAEEGPLRQEGPRHLQGTVRSPDPNHAEAAPTQPGRTPRREVHHQREEIRV